MVITLCFCNNFFFNILVYLILISSIITFGALFVEIFLLLRRAKRNIEHYRDKHVSNNDVSSEKLLLTVDEEDD